METLRFGPNEAAKTLPRLFPVNNIARPYSTYGYIMSMQHTALLYTIAYHIERMAVSVRNHCSSYTRNTACFHILPPLKWSISPDRGEEFDFKSLVEIVECIC
jgi:hypothetical protein